MPCWVTPEAAAEYWSVPLPDVMREVAEGRITSRREGGLVFINVSLDDPADQPPAFVQEPARTRRALAWNFITTAERKALLESMPVEQETAALPQIGTKSAGSESCPATDTDHDPDPPEIAVELTADDAPKWNEVRARVSRTRRPPPAARANAA